MLKIIYKVRNTFHRTVKD